MQAKTTEIETYIINKVKEYRLNAKMSQRKLSRELNLSPSFVFQAENPLYGTKYNHNQLNELAKLFNCSVSDFMPHPYVKTDCMEEFMQIHPRFRKKYEELQRKEEEKSKKKLEEKKKKERKAKNKDK
ncbi:helix-turn-helix transcriptional regulator [Butyricimonas sp.]|uniref:helix-turn-helix domain-containing protein n=1 Tax=Butyricimonas sp. TaxID=1969738 RepID=UPI0025BFE375|nr:helix-turn-helix transcriptional regulator [Butyricimonas sp.]